MTRGFARVRAFFGAVIALVVYRIVGGTVIFLRVPFRKNPAAPDDALAATGLLGRTALNGLKARVARIRPALAGLASASSGSRRVFLKGTLIFRDREGDHRYMHVGGVGGPSPSAAAS
jgi:hypothetical protein